MERIYADFHNADRKGRVRLNTNGSIRDIAQKNIKLEEGKKIILDSKDGIVTIGTLTFSTDENMWVAKIDWDKI
jgi:hypothetical protein